MKDSLPRNRRTGAFERRVARVLARSLETGNGLVVACSGGPDSTAALVATARWARAHDAPVTAACFDHRLRSAEETAADATFVESVAAQLRVRFVAGRAARRPSSKGHGVEDAARNARYRWLARVCLDAGASRCVLGHTLNDQAETVLLRLVRGTGLSGARGMAELVPWPLSGGRGLSVLRPLLEVTRFEVEGYLAALGLEARLDPSNESLDFDRNRVRHRVLPELRTLNPRADEALARFAASARDDEQALEDWASEDSERIVRYSGRGVGREARIDRRALTALPRAVGARVVRNCGERLGLELESVHLLALLDVARRRGAHVSLPRGHGRTRDGELVISRTSRGRPGMGTGSVDEHVSEP